MSSRAGDIGFADGWQKDTKSYASDIHKQGEVARATTSAIENVRNEANATKTNANAGETAKPVQEKPAQPTTKTQPQSSQQQGSEVKSEAQDTAAHIADARQGFLNAKQDAQALRQLENKLPQAGSSTELMTNNAVVQKPQSPAADLARNVLQNPAAAQAAAASKAVQPGKNTERTREDTGKPRDTKATDKPAREGDTDKQAQAKLAEAAAKPNAAASAEAAKVAGSVHKAEGDSNTDEPSEDEEGKSSETREHRSSSTYTSRVAGRERGKELGALLGGFSGSSADAGTGHGEGSEQVSAAASACGSAPLPATDPNFHVYSEFDSEVAGPEMIKGKALVYNKFVEKRLNEIAQFDQDLGTKMKEMFTTLPLSDRIVGELKDELSSAKFLGSIYGGVIG